MKRLLWAALAVLASLGPWAPQAFAGGYGSGFYAGTDIFVARAHAPIYDCPRPGCRTNIRLRAGSSIYAICWDGGEGWCRVQTRYFQNMFVPRYALDLAYGGHKYKSYYYGEKYPHKYQSSKGCYYKDRYYHKGRYGEGCYDKYGSNEYRGYPYKAYSADTSYKRPYKQDDYYSGGYKSSGYSGGYGDGYKGGGYQDGYPGGGYKHSGYSSGYYGGGYKGSGYSGRGYPGGDYHGGGCKGGGYKCGGYQDGGYEGEGGEYDD